MIYSQVLERSFRLTYFQGFNFKIAKVSSNLIRLEFRKLARPDGMLRASSWSQVLSESKISPPRSLMVSSWGRQGSKFLFSPVYNAQRNAKACPRKSGVAQREGDQYIDCKNSVPGSAKLGFYAPKGAA